jgi:propanol-preferring alcohol dehydrogenase
MICSGATALKALKESDLRTGQFVAIIGAAGGVGHLACQLGVTMGLRVLAVEINGYKTRFCESLGAELAIDLTDLRCDSKSPAEQIRAYTEGIGAHAVLCCAPDAKAVSSAVDMCRRTGMVVVVATPPGDMRLPIADMVLRRITVRGCAPPTKQDILEALDFAARGVVRAQVTHAQLSDVNLVYDRLKQKAYEGKVVIRM